MLTCAHSDDSTMTGPTVVSYNKHVLVMSFIGQDGVAARKLRDAPLSKKMANECFTQVRHAMHALYHECRLVHADLSEYNILYHKKKVWIIDVGQAVEPTHPRAHEYLFRDCLQVVRFFKAVGATDVPEASVLFTEVCAEAISSEQALEFQQTMNAAKGGIKRGSGLDTQDVSDVVLNFMPVRKHNASEVLAINPEAAGAASGSDEEEEEEEDEEDEVYEEEVGDVHPEIAAARKAGKGGKGKVKACFRCGDLTHRVKECPIQAAAEVDEAAKEAAERVGLVPAEEDDAVVPEDNSLVGASAAE